MKLSDIKTEVVNLAEVGTHELLIHDNRLFMLIGYDDRNKLVNLQALSPGLAMQSIAITGDTLFERVVSVRIEQ